MAQFKTAANFSNDSRLHEDSKLLKQPWSRCRWKLVVFHPVWWGKPIKPKKMHISVLREVSLRSETYPPPSIFYLLWIGCLLLMKKKSLTHSYYVKTTGRWKMAQTQHSLINIQKCLRPWRNSARKIKPFPYHPESSPHKESPFLSFIAPDQRQRNDRLCMMFYALLLNYSV